jgi:hypothetical protein
VRSRLHGVNLAGSDSYTQWRERDRSEQVECAVRWWQRSALTGVWLEWENGDKEKLCPTGLD